MWHDYILIILPHNSHKITIDLITYGIDIMKKTILSSLFLSLVAFNGQTAEQNNKCEFLWGVASAAYQVEGGWNIGGKGESNWDYFTHKGVTKHIIGKSDNGDIATNQISRDVYLKDIKLMEELGVNSYRFSINWARVLPDGQHINQEGLDYYKTLIADLHAAGIKPVITLHHWDMPLTLYKKGGWGNPESPEWFDLYAKLIFNNFAKDTPYFITFNEPEGYIFTLNPLVENLISDVPSPYEKALSVASRAQQALAMHHILLANALAVKRYHKNNYDGKIGIALNLSPCIDTETPGSVAEKNCNTVHNEWILDALYTGKYPASIEKIYKDGNKNFNPSEKEMAEISEGKPDFIGVNYYAPTLVKVDTTQPFSIGNRPNPDVPPSYNGPVAPNDLLSMLVSLDKKYNHPDFIITENGAGYGPDDEKTQNNIVEDKNRTHYLESHIAIIEKAHDAGVNLKGYLYWSLLDNFEWLWGYQNRFGLIKVDFTSPELKRTPKLSYYKYQQIIKSYKEKPICPKA